MSMYKMFKTDADLERKGVDIDYGDFIVTIARAGGANRRFLRLLEQKTKPYRRAIQTETMDEKLAEDIMRQVYAEGAVLNWQTKVGEDEDGRRVFAVGIEPPEDAKGTGEHGLLPFNAETVADTFRRLPELFTDLQQQANKIALFRQELLEADGKN